jgi:hypothetical protein
MSALSTCGHHPGAIRDGACQICLTRQKAGKSPSLARKAVNLARSVAQHVAAGMPRVDDATYAARLKACATCELNSGTTLNPTCRHPSCGCRMVVKARMAEQACPHPDGSKWPLPMRSSP